jgi:hypothetical protein
MAAIRFKHRVIHQALYRLIEDGLTDLGWVTPPVNFATTPLTFVDYQPDERGRAIAANTIAITTGDEGEDSGEELGWDFGGLQSVSIPVFVDIYGEEQAISVAIASDVKSILKNYNAPLLSYDNTDTGAQLTIETVLGPERPLAAASAGGENFKRYWRVVKGMTVTYFNE